MLNLLFYSTLASILCLVFLLSIRISFKTAQSKEKESPFECGFDPSGSSRLRFCMKFFLLGVIFVIFDVEVSLILPLPFRQVFIIVFFIVLLVGLLYE